MITQKYLFEAFLPYQKTIALARWVKGLASLKRKLDRKGPISDNALDCVVFNARSIFPEIRIPGASEEEMQEMLKRDSQIDSMTPDEIQEHMDQRADEIRSLIDNGELDIWDDTIKYAKVEDIIDFVQVSKEMIQSKLLKACNPNAAFIEKVILEIFPLLGEDTSKELRGYEALLICWDYAKIQYEGEPPYKIAFATQVVDALGLDPVMASININRLDPLGTQALRKLRVSASLAKTILPQYTEQMETMVELCEAVR